MNATARISSPIIFFLLCGSCIIPYPEILAPGATTSPSFDGAEHSSIVVLVENNVGRSVGDGFMQQVQDLVVSGAIQNGFRVSAAGDRSYLLDELEFQGSGWTDRDALKVGRMLNVSAVLVISLDGFSSEESKSLWAGDLDHTTAKVGGRMLSVRTTEVIWATSFSYSGLFQDPEGLVLRLSQAISDGLPDINSFRRVDDGGVLPEQNSEGGAYRARKSSADQATVVVTAEDLTGKLGRGDLRQIENEMIRGLVAAGLRVPARSDRELILEELQYQREGLTDADYVEAGRQLNARYFLVISINGIAMDEAGDTYRKPVLGELRLGRRGFDVSAIVSARTIDIKKGEIGQIFKYTGEIRIPDDHLLGVAVAGIVGQLANRVAISFR